MTNNNNEKEDKNKESCISTLSRYEQHAFQFAGVTFFTGVFLLVGPFCLFCLFVLPFLTGVYWHTILYMSWWAWDLQTCNTGGRPSYITSWMRRWRIMNSFVNYFPIKIRKTADLPANKNYLFCSHPHGVLCYGTFGAMASEAAGFSDLFPGIHPKLITLEGSLWLPGFRELLLGIGSCASSKQSLQCLLSSKPGVSPVLMVGGLPEISNFEKNKIKLVIMKRKGFIKLALENGADLVPVFSFGEAELFDQPGAINSFLQDHVASRLGFYPVVFSGRGYMQNWFGILPRKQEINVVVGRPIRVDKVDRPSQEQVESLHHTYLEQVKLLFQENKALYGCEDVILEII